MAVDGKAPSYALATGAYLPFPKLPSLRYSGEVPDGEPIDSKTNRKGISTIRLLIPCVVIGMLAFGYLLATWSEGPQTQFEWMSFQQMNTSRQPSPLQKLKYKLVSIAGPLLRWYKPNRPNIVISVDLVSVPAQWEAASGIGSPFSTNLDGTKAWILRETDFRTVRKKIEDAYGADLVNSARLVTADGRMAQIQSIQMVPIGSATGSASTSPVGMIVDLDPKVVAHSIRLFAGVSSTSTCTGTNGIAIQTNAAVCSRVLLPNGGGLVLSARGKDSSANTNFWIIISTAATDSKGTRIRL